MKIKHIICLLCIFLLTPTIPLTGSVEEIYVPQDYPTIQDAVDNANEGATIIVTAGNYTENVNIYKPLNLVGQNAWVSALNSSEHVFKVTSNYVNITGFTILNASGYVNEKIDVPYVSGIVLYQASYCNISNNIVRNSHIGINLHFYSDYNIIQNNTVEENRSGIMLVCSDFNNITKNTVQKNKLYGIFLRGDSDYNIISENFLTQNSNEGGNAIQISFGFANKIRFNEIINNLGRGGDYGTGHGIQVNGGNLDYTSNNTVIEYNVIKGNKVAISLAFVGNSTIHDNIFANSTWVNIALSGAISNLFYRNDFIVGNGGNQFFISNSSQTSINIWSKDGEGNYWSDHDGIDENGDGIADTPYVLDENNVDEYPFVNPIADPPQTSNPDHDRLTDNNGGGASRKPFFL